MTAISAGAAESKTPWLSEGLDPASRRSVETEVVEAHWAVDRAAYWKDQEPGYKCVDVFLGLATVFIGLCESSQGSLSF